MSKATDDFLPALKFIPDGFVTRKMIKKLHAALFANNEILFFDKDSGNVTFSSDEMGIISVDRNYVNIDDVDFYENVLETIIHVRLMTWNNKLKQHMAFNNDVSKELMALA